MRARSRSAPRTGTERGAWTPSPSISRSWTWSRRPPTRTRSPSRCPAEHAEQFALQARPVPDRGGAERPHRGGGALLLPLQQPDRRPGSRSRSRSSAPPTATPRTGSATTSARATRCGCSRRAGSSPRRPWTTTCCSSRAAAGITPVMSITRTALAQGSGRVVLFYANRDERSVIFAARARPSWRPSTPTGWSSCTGWSRCRGCPSQEQLRAFAAAYPTYDAFVCGPAPFMKAGRRRAQGARVPARAAAPGEVRLAGRQPVRRPARGGDRRARDRRRRDRPGRRAERRRRRSPGRRARSSSRSSSTARTTPSTTGRPAPSCSTTSRRRA